MKKKKYEINEESIKFAEDTFKYKDQLQGDDKLLSCVVLPYLGLGGVLSILNAEESLISIGEEGNGCAHKAMRVISELGEKIIDVKLHKALDDIGEILESCMEAENPDEEYILNLQKLVSMMLVAQCSGCVRTVCGEMTPVNTMKKKYEINEESIKFVENTVKYKDQLQGDDKLLSCVVLAHLALRPTRCILNAEESLISIGEEGEGCVHKAMRVISELGEKVIDVKVCKALDDVEEILEHCMEAENPDEEYILNLQNIMRIIYVAQQVDTKDSQPCEQDWDEMMKLMEAIDLIRWLEAEENNKKNNNEEDSEDDKEDGDQ